MEKSLANGQRDVAFNMSSAWDKEKPGLFPRLSGFPTGTQHVMGSSQIFFFSACSSVLRASKKPVSATSLFTQSFL